MPDPIKDANPWTPTPDYLLRITLGREIAKYRQLLEAAPDLVEALKLALEALETSKPMMAHYPEPVERHDVAMKAAKAALARAGAVS